MKKRKLKRRIRELEHQLEYANRRAEWYWKQYASELRKQELGYGAEQTKRPTDGRNRRIYSVGAPVEEA